MIGHLLIGLAVFLANGAMAQTSVANANTAPAPAAPLPVPVALDKAEKGKILFKRTDSGDNLPMLETTLNGVEFLGPLYPKEGGMPYVLLSALECEGCAQRFLYMFRVGSTAKQEPLRLIFPGRVRDKQTGGTVYEGRAFYGKCVPNKGDAFVVYQSDKIKKRRGLQSSVFIAEVQDSGIEEHVITRRHPRLDTILGQVRRKQCAEIKGVDRDTQKFKWPTKPNLEIEKPDEPETEKAPAGSQANPTS